MFDLDGTLLDTLADLGDAANAALREHGFAEHAYAFYRQAVGDGARVLAARSVPPERRDDATVVDAVHAAMRAHYARNWHRKTRPYPGIPELLTTLRARGLTLAVLSNKPEEATRDCVRHFFPDAPFAAVRGAVTGGPLKPDPSAALRIVDELGIAPDAWLYVGDTNTDMRTAVAARLFAVGCTWGFRDRDELATSGAAAIVDHPAALLAWC